MSIKIIHTGALFAMLLLMVCVLFTASITFAEASWQGTSWVSTGQPISATKMKSNLDYLKAQVDGFSGGDNLGNHSATQNVVFNNYGIGSVGKYNSRRYQNVFSMGASYTPATDGTSLNNMYGIAWTHSNIGGESIAGLSHQALFVTAGDTKSAIGSGIWTKYDVIGNRFLDQNNRSYYLDPASVSYLNDIRPNIIYDRNNTSYYLNPNSNSRMYRIYANDVRSDIFYDRNNTSYYVNPASTSRLNRINATSFYYASDKKLKKDIKTLSGLSIINKLRGVSFNWKENSKPSVGLIAQEVEEVLPELVDLNPETGIKSVQYGNLVAPLIEAVKELSAKVNAQQAEIEALKNAVNK